MWFKIIWLKGFRNKIRTMERRKRGENINKMLEAAGVEGSVDYLSGVDDGYFMACEEILEWIEKRKN